VNASEHFKLAEDHTRLCLDALEDSDRDAARVYATLAAAHAQLAVAAATIDAAEAARAPRVLYRG
jgi:outer membrane protein TolC